MTGRFLMTLALLMTLGFSTGAWANCVYQGTVYPPGTVIAGLTCQPNGTWR